MTTSWLWSPKDTAVGGADVNRCASFTQTAANAPARLLPADRIERETYDLDLAVFSRGLNERAGIVGQHQIHPPVGRAERDRVAVADRVLRELDEEVGDGGLGVEEARVLEGPAERGAARGDESERGGERGERRADERVEAGVARLEAKVALERRRGVHRAAHMAGTLSWAEGPRPRTLAFDLYDLPITLPRVDSFRQRGHEELDELTLPELFRESGP